MDLERISRSLSTESSCSEESKALLEGIGIGRQTTTGQIYTPKPSQISQRPKSLNRSTTESASSDEQTSTTRISRSKMCLEQVHPTEHKYTTAFEPTETPNTIAAERNDASIPGKCRRLGNRSVRLQRYRPNGGAGNRDRDLAKLARFAPGFGSGAVRRFPAGSLADEPFVIEWLGKRNKGHT